GGVCEPNVLINDSSKGARDGKKKQINNPSQDFDFVVGEFKLTAKPRVWLGAGPRLHNIR
ncbi:MAG: hypothetical protein ACREDT_11420, partial [Methylocella sp.]